MSGNSNGSIKVSGGNLYINSSGDGMDANGTPRRLTPSRQISDTPRLRSMISCVIRAIAREIAVASMICAFCFIASPPFGQIKKSCLSARFHTMVAQNTTMALFVMISSRHLCIGLKMIFSDLVRLTVLYHNRLRLSRGTHKKTPE